MEMPQEVFEDFLVALDTENNGIMRKGNQLAHEFTIEEERTYTKHLAFSFSWISEARERGREPRSRMFVKGVKKKVSGYISAQSLTRKAG